MRPVLKDLLMGDTRLSNQDVSVWTWTEGNWSCDCNRAIACGKPWATSSCGNKRFVVVEVHGDLEGWDPESLIARCNEGYERAILNAPPRPHPCQQRR